MTNKFRIAFCGVFDLVNYGDHIFPIVFEKELQQRGLDVEILLFSNIECIQEFNGHRNIYDIKNLEKMHIERSFDAIVVGGGELIHFYYATQRKVNSQDFEKYSIPNLWMIPSIISYKYNVKLLWNAVGVLYKFDVRQKEILQALCSQVDYLSVRNVFSKESLVDGRIEQTNIEVIPDTALKICEHYSLEYLTRNKKVNLPNDEKFIIFHCNRFISEQDKQETIRCLKVYADLGFGIILLPLAYTHGDEETLKEISNLDSRFFIFKEKLSLIDMMYLLAKCELYIGVSFHGAVTALQYGRKAIALDFMKYFKTRDLFTHFNIEQYYLNDTKQLQKCINEALTRQEPIDMKSTLIELNKHFDKMYNEIYNIRKKVSVNNNFSSEIIKGMIDSYHMSDNYIKELRESLNFHIKKVAELNNVLEGYQASDKEKTIKVVELNSALEGYQLSDKEKTIKIIELNNALEGYQNSDTNKALELEEKNKYILELEESVRWHVDKVKELDAGIHWHLDTENRKDESIEKMKQDISRYCAHIFEIENSRWWKIGKLFRKK